MEGKFEGQKGKGCIKKRNKDEVVGKIGCYSCTHTTEERNRQGRNDRGSLSFFWLQWLFSQQHERTIPGS